MISVYFQTLVDYLKKTKKLSNNDKRKVYSLVTHAIRSTKTHITRTRQNGTDVPSGILSLLWQNASEELRNFGDDELKQFAQILEHKSKYWSSPTDYNERLIDELSMYLVQVEETLNILTE